MRLAARDPPSRHWSGDCGRDDGSLRALAVVHNETSTAITNPIAEVRRVLDQVGHAALLLVDTVSSLGSIEYRHDEWGVDVSIAASQKGLMLPPGLCFHAISEKALAAHGKAKLARSYWDWGPMLDANETGYFPYTPATNMLFGLREALAILAEEGLARVYARHHRLAEATRRAVTAWGLELYCTEPEVRSDTVTAVRVGEDLDAEALREEILQGYDLSLGAGLGPLKGEVFRIRPSRQLQRADARGDPERHRARPSRDGTRCPGWCEPRLSTTSRRHHDSTPQLPLTPALSPKGGEGGTASHSPRSRL